MNKLGLVDSPQHVVNFCVFIHVIDMTHILCSLQLYKSCVTDICLSWLTYGPISAVYAVQFACLEIFPLSDDDILLGESCRHLQPILGDG